MRPLSIIKHNILCLDFNQRKSGMVHNWIYCCVEVLLCQIMEIFPAAACLPGAKPHDNIIHLQIVLCCTALN